MLGWLHEHAGVLVAASIGASVALLLAVAVWAVRMPADYFVRDQEDAQRTVPRHPALRMVLLVIGNVAGFALAALGVLMTLPLVPGPGIVLVLIGLSLTSFPGKHKLQRRIITSHWVLAPLNRLRAAFNKPPLQVPRKSGESSDGSGPSMWQRLKGNLEKAANVLRSRTAFATWWRQSAPPQTPRNPRPFRYIVALLGVAVAVGLKLMLQPMARQDEASLGFFAVVMFAAWYGGLGPGLLATAVSAIVSDYLFLSPHHTFGFHSRSDCLRLIQFLAEGTLISAMGGSLHRAEARACAEKERAEAANRAKDDFLATVSHELRTPLTAILSWVYVLRTVGTDPSAEDDRAEGLEAIELSAKAQSKLIEDLLDVSRITAGRLRLAMGPVNARQFVETAVDTVRPMAEAKGVELRSEIEDVGNVSGDSDRLQQVVWNLATNSIKFTPAGGSVAIRLMRSNGRAKLIVTDTGIGIKRECLPRLFERFEQVDQAGARRQGGLGLGLAIVRHLVELHGGTVQAQSEGEGRGASFAVEIPLLPSDVNAPH
ncbi:MAG: Chemotaxis protein methyltransferase CheR [Phycisphaerales bacterium]|nr:Chemotaxis protein methyltransferase CheR [Phycisphaerales bacterium]